MTIKPFCTDYGIDAVYGIDFETYYDKDYSLRKMATTEYITDPRFELQLASVQRHDEKKPTVFKGAEFKAWAKGIDWKRVGLLAHHAQFDGLIASHHCGIKPAMYFDTLSMARPIMPVTVGGSLKAITEAFGRVGKKRAQALVNVMGKRLADFTAKELKELMLYAGDDISDTWFIFNKMLSFIPAEEMRLIDATVKLYAQPMLRIDKAMVDAVQQGQVESKAELVSNLKVPKEALTSNDKFAELLRKAGVDPPTKISKRTGQVALAMSKQDLEFKELLKHPKKRVRDLVTARLAVKTSILETRAERMSNRSSLPAQPVYLNYYGAKTGRWSGGDKSNYQNLSRGSDLRKALLAPVGHKLIIADLAQIEARINAWFHSQNDIVSAFAAKEDVYKVAASRIYNKPIEQITKDERFLGKCCVLALGYGAGAPRFAEMLRVGALGPPVDISDSLAADIVKAWRSTNAFIVAGWRRAQNNAKSAFVGKQRIEDRVIAYQGHEGKGVTELPGGMYIRYDGFEVDEEGMSYVSKFRRNQKGEANIERQRLYGGLIVENNVQALARRVVAEHALAIIDETKQRLVMTTHDELVFAVPNRSAEKTLRAVKSIMSTPPTWAPDLPIAVEAHISERYDK